MSSEPEKKEEQLVKIFIPLEDPPDEFKFIGTVVHPPKPEEKPEEKPDAE